MKILTLVMVLVPLLFGDGTVWLSWKQAQHLSKRTHKPIMIEAMRDGCRYCVKMDKEVFADKEFAEYLHAKFIPVKVNLSKEAMPIDEEPAMTPTFYFVDSSKRLIKEVPGSWSQEDFKAILKEIR